MVNRIGEIRRFDHIVLLVAAKAVLRAEGGGEVEPACRERVERMGEVGGDRGRMGEQGDALALERAAQRRLGEQAVDSEFHGCGGAASSAAKQSDVMEIGLARRMSERPERLAAAFLLDHRREAERPAGVGKQAERLGEIESDR